MNIKNENSDPTPSADEIKIFSNGPMRPTVFKDVNNSIPVP